MRESQPLKPLSGPPADFKLTHRLGGAPLRAKPERAGNIDLLCPHCSTVLIAGTDGRFEGITAIQCYSCRQWSTGIGLRSRAPSEWHYRTPVGTFWIRPQPDSGGRFWLGVDEEMPIGSYHSPEAAADAFAGGHTGWHEWDAISHTVDAPRDLSEWRRGRPSGD